MLNRYLLPVLPIVFAAMVAAISILPRVQRLVATAVLLIGMAVSNFINPPYPFPYEENLAFTDFVRLHADAADYVSHWYADPVVHTAWPMSANSPARTWATFHARSGCSRSRTCRRQRWNRSTGARCRSWSCSRATGIRKST